MHILNTEYLNNMYIRPSFLEYVCRELTICLLNSNKLLNCQTFIQDFKYIKLDASAYEVHLSVLVNIKGVMMMLSNSFRIS